jgi:Glycosyltransferase
MRKLKVLALAVDDNRLTGHAYDSIQKMNPLLYETKLITLRSYYNDSETAFFTKKIQEIPYKIRRRISSYLRYGTNKIVRGEEIHSYHGYLSYVISAKQILKKYGDAPDLIILFWYDGFVDAKIIHDLHKLTNATIAFDFVDEFALAGGCHYPCGCEGYKAFCENCPAVSFPKDLAKEQLALRYRYLKDIPKITLGASSFSCQNSRQSTLFKDTKTILGLNIPDIPIMITKSEARKQFNIQEDAFVIMFGSSFLAEKRKGYGYLVEALKLMEKQMTERPIVVFIPGDKKKVSKEEDTSFIKYHYPGRLDFETLCKAFIASDIFVNPTIADSGPMMVNYAIACGTPVVSFNMGVAMNLVINGKTGYIAQMKDARSLSEGILEFYQMNPEKLEEYRFNCKALMEEWRNKPSRWDLLYQHITNDLLK